MRRSPTPSATSAQTFTPSTSRYLLHVLPPSHLPHDPIRLSNPDTLHPPHASGYHPQFRRGVLVPVYPTLPTQLAAIAREYALPSTLGMVLYLITTSPELGKGAGPEVDEPGPRISEDIWRHIWTRVLRSEKEDSLPSAPRPLGLGIGLANQSAPTLLQNVTQTQSPIQMTHHWAGHPIGHGLGSSPSSASNSAFSSQSELDPPESISSLPDPHADDLALPGLHSPALVPILAKVEFDVDRRKAGWYSTWVRSRQVSQAKRAGSRARGRRGTGGSDVSVAEGEGDEERNGPINLRLVKRMEKHAIPSFLRSEETFEDDEDEYMRLPDTESPGEMEDEDVTARLNGDGDPLADVFGTDAETWVDLRASVDPGTRRRRNPNVVELALDGAALGELDDEDGMGLDGEDDIRDVEELWRRKNRPSLMLSINGRRGVPPPLNLEPSLRGSSNVVVTVCIHFQIFDDMLKMSFAGCFSGLGNRSVYLARQKSRGREARWCDIRRAGPGS